LTSNLRRSIGLIEAIGIGLGAIVGAGLFVVIGLAAGVAGPAMLVGLVIAGFGATFNALSSASLAARFPRAGGTYEYGNRTLNPWLGFIAGWMFLASKLSAAGVVALGFGNYAAMLVPQLDPRWTGLCAAIALIGANLFGIKKAGRLNLFIVFATLAALLVFLITVAPAVKSTNFQPFAPNGALSAVQAASLLFFAYTGYARLAILGEEVSDPSRTIPRAIIWSIAIASILYVLVCAVAVGAIGAEAMAASKSPLEAAAATATLPFTPTVVVIGACTAMLGVLLSQILGISRMMFAMGRGGDLPSVLAKTNAHHIPHWAVLTTGAFILAVAWFGKLEFVAASASFTILLYYGITNIAALRMPVEDRRFPAWVSWCGLIFCIAMAAALSAPVVVSGLAVLALGVIGRLTAKAIKQS
jgi:APA family basic amino acid/polyamine antiporter